MIGIGIDTGGTYTDAVVYDMDRKKILCSGKALTTKSELEKGITEALDMLEPDYVKKAELLPHWLLMPVWRTRGAGRSF